MPHTSSFRCASCGAPLSVPPNIKIFVCKYCRSEQEIAGDGDALFLRKTAKSINSSTERIASELAIVRLRKDIPHIRNRLANAEQELQRNKFKLRSIDDSLAQNTPPPEFQISRYTLFSDVKEFQLVCLVSFLIMTAVIIIFHGFLIKAIAAVILSGVCFYGLFEGLQKHSKEVVLHPQQEATRKKNLGLDREIAKQGLQKSQLKLDAIQTELDSLNAELERHVAVVNRVG